MGHYTEARNNNFLLVILLCSITTIIFYLKTRQTVFENNY